MAYSFRNLSITLTPTWAGRFGAGVAAAIVLQAAPGWAQRNQDYSPVQFISVLNGLGYPVELTDKPNSANVQQAIRDFQLQNNLPVTGQLTPETQDLAATLIQNLQNSLNQALKPTPNLPGNQFYGSQTEALVKVFQDQNRLPMTGIATLETRRLLATTLTPAVPQAVPQAIPQSAPATIRPVDEPAPPAPKPPVNPAPVQASIKFGNLYTDAEFREILQGLGYDIAPQKFLSDAPATIAIQHFQARYGLSQTGVADQPTQDKARTILRVLQANLRLVVDPNLTTTEFYDTQTRDAVRAFQRQNRLRQDGIATIPVRQAIDTLAKQALRQP
jgi:peptidoglycan hydrolase-like protein with peptidoglycan-binding domain